MVTKDKVVKLFVSLGVKGILCIICLASVTAALVSYTSTVTVNPTVQLTQGANSVTWTVYVNEVDQVRYLPGGFTEETLDESNSSTYCFRVVTDSRKVCAVKIELTSSINASKFSTFDITIRSSTGGAWGDETLYSGSTGSSTKAAIDGSLPSDNGYVHQAVSTIKYYEIKVTYSYDLVDDNDAVPITVRLTPLPLDSFT